MSIQIGLNFMKYFVLIWSNLKRKKVRTVLTCCQSWWLYLFACCRRLSRP